MFDTSTSQYRIVRDDNSADQLSSNRKTNQSTCEQVSRKRALGQLTGWGEGCDAQTSSNELRRQRLSIQHETHSIAKTNCLLTQTAAGDQRSSCECTRTRARNLASHQVWRILFETARYTNMIDPEKPTTREW